VTEAQNSPKEDGEDEIFQEEKLRLKGLAQAIEI
jgi:hypothetical protein